MSWYNRLKLNSLPIVNDADLHPRLANGTEMDMIRTTMAMLGGSNPSEVMEIDAKLKKYSDTKLREWFGKILLSLAQADAYLVDDKISDRKNRMRSKWKLHKNILVKLGIELGFVEIPEKFIVRTGSDMWVAYDVPNPVFFELGYDDLYDEWDLESGG